MRLFFSYSAVFLQVFFYHGQV